MRWPIVLAVLLLAACGLVPHAGTNRIAPPAEVTASPVSAAICKIGPDDGPEVAERGIGGTGMPAFAPVPAAVGAGGAVLPAAPGKDRGIGGTGAPAMPGSNAPTAGIFGAITGFASICVDGAEVHYNTATPITIDGRAAGPEDLRAGQIVAVTAGVVDKTFQARNVRVRHEVAGPVEDVAPGRLIVAGQTVLITPTTRGLVDAPRNAWVDVSGLRNRNGAVVATRLDPIPPGRVLVHGIIHIVRHRFWIGELPLTLPPGAMKPHDKEPVTVTGSLQNGSLIVDTISEDLLISQPRKFFGANATWLLLETFVDTSGGVVRFAFSPNLVFLPFRVLHNPLRLLHDVSRPVVLLVTQGPASALPAAGICGLSTWSCPAPGGDTSPGQQSPAALSPAPLAPRHP